MIILCIERGNAQSLPAAVTYYVSSSTGSDSFDGLSPSTPFASIAKINSLNLLPGDRVLFRCGDTWRGEQLHITRSGAAGSPIVFSSYPSETCPDRPNLSGAQPIQGWTLFAPNIYAASLANPANAPFFPMPAITGINQLFRSGQRLGIARWPNLDAPNGGFATVDAQPGAAILQDDQLPAGNWTGASLHIRGMRWYILNRTISAMPTANQLALNATLDCWAGNCTGWGYWINNAYAALDREGEWFFDQASRTVYLYTTSDPNQAAIEGSLVFANPSADPAGIVLGRHLQEHITSVTINNFEVSRWYLHGISTPVNLEKDENSLLVIQNNAIHDVDGAGINLAAWVWNAAANGNGYNGWRGGRNLTIQNNRIQTANQFGINSYARQSLFQSNQVLDIALIPNLGAAGMGCAATAGGGLCTEDGDGIRLKVSGDGAYTSNQVTLRYNDIERTGYNGIDLFGAQNTFTNNVIIHACVSKGDCGALRTFGSASLAATTTRDLTISGNLILDPIGSTDGNHPNYAARFAFGLYIDNYTASASITGNTIRGASASGLLFQNSSGAASANLLFDNASGGYAACQAAFTGGPTLVNGFAANLLFARLASAATLCSDTASLVTGSNQNQFFHPSRSAHISSQGNKTLAQWQTYSGQDHLSTETINAGLADAVLFFNPMQTSLSIALERPFTDLAGSPQSPTLTLAPYNAIVLLPAGPPDKTRIFLPLISRR